MLAGQGGAVAAGEQPEAIRQTLGDLFQRHRTDARCGQFQGERDAIQTIADIGQGGGVGVGDLEGRLHGQGTIDKEAHRFILGQDGG